MYEILNHLESILIISMFYFRRVDLDTFSFKNQIKELKDNKGKRKKNE